MAVDTSEAYSVGDTATSPIDDGAALVPTGSPTTSSAFGLEEFVAPFSLPEAFDAGYGEDQHDYDELEVDGVDIVPNFREVLRKQVTPTRIKLRDKLTFMTGTVGSLLNAYWLGWSPETFYRVYSLEAVVLIAVRWVVYRMKKWHYYLWDFCYFANIVLLIQLWLLPKSALLNKVMFAYSAGPLAWSIVAFRNSLVFHSLDKITSLMLHWMPACVVWTLRWYPQRVGHKLDYDSKSEEAKAEWQHGSLTSLVVIPLLPYLLWAVAYYIKIFVISSDKIQKRGYETLYQFACQNEKSLFGRVVLKAPKRLQPLVYMVMHMALVTLTFLLARLFWESFAAHTIFLLFILASSAYNGASFYFEVFAHRYLDQVGIPQKRGHSHHD